MSSHRQFDDSIRTAMLELVCGHAKDSPLQRALASVTHSAVELVDGVDFADVMVIVDGQARSISPTVPILADLDALQMKLQQGPCLESAVSSALVRCTDLSVDPRWPEYAAEAKRAGVLSSLSFQLDTGSNGSGALNLFGVEPREDDPKAEAVGALLATLATVAFMTADKQTQFETALANRDVIAQAKGILMNHYKVDADRAFDMMRHLSQTDNTPVGIIAQRIIEHV